MPKLLRILFTGSAFLGFFLFAGVLGRLMLPLVVAFPGTPEPVSYTHLTLPTSDLV